ncbi:membrane protein [Streptomyces sp. MMG1121]|nr:membrane protein [Streptomyces sp. MMG1121]
MSRVLVCAAAVPAVLITAACSSDSGDSKSKGGDSSAQASTGGSGTPSSAGASPTVQAAAYKKLPDPCAMLSKKTLTDLVPKAASAGKKGTSNDSSARSSCSWSSLDNNGVKGSQFRWLNVSLLRFDSDTARGSGDAQAHTYFTQQVKDAQTVDGAQNAKQVPLSGAGAEAAAVRYDLKKKEGLFKQQTVVARVENVVVTLDYNGAGLAGDETPSADDLTQAAEKAVKEAVGAVSAANGASSSGSSASSPAPSESASKDPAKSPSSSPSSSASPSKSADKKS